MTDDERRASRTVLLAEIVDAIEDEKDCCGRLAGFIQSFEKLVEAGKARALVCQPDERHGFRFCKAKSDQDPTPASQAFVLPTLSELAEAVKDCRKATRRIAAAREAARSAGIILNDLAG